MQDLARLRHRLSPAELFIVDQALGYLIVQLRAMHHLDRTDAENDVLRELTILRTRLRNHDDPDASV